MKGQVKCSIGLAAKWRLVALTSLIMLQVQVCRSQPPAACSGISTEAELRQQLSLPATGSGGTTITLCGDLSLTQTVKIKDAYNFVCPSGRCKISPASGSPKFLLVSVEASNAELVTTFTGFELTGATASAVQIASGNTAVFNRVTFRDNIGPEGGAVVSNGNATFDDCSFVNNTATNGGGGGLLSSGPLTITRGNFTSNSAATTGGAIMATDGLVTIRGCYVYNNSAQQSGGGFYVVGNANSVISGNSFGGNSALGKSSDFTTYGGGLFVGGTTSVGGNLYENNFAWSAGGALAIDGAVNPCGPSQFANNSAANDAASFNLYALGTFTGSLCGDLPAGTNGLSPNASVSDCSTCTCINNGPCDPSAGCTPTGLGVICTCNPSFSGTGYICSQGVNPGPFPGVLSTAIVSSPAPAPTDGLIPSPQPMPGPGGSPPPPSTRSGPTPSTSSGTNTTSSEGGDNDGTNVGAIIGGVVAGVVVVVVLAVVVALVKRRRRREIPMPPTPGHEKINIALFGTFRHFDFPEVQQATENFAQANLLGKGGFGMVYVGEFEDGTMLAVKRLMNTQQGQAESEFLKELRTLEELRTLGQVRHRNLNALKGFCISDKECILILEYAAGGNLDQALRDPTRPLLTWPQRMNIAVGAARGLLYLHQDCRPNIIHRDIKSPNILLDADGEAQVADFGLAKLLDSGETHRITEVKGTYGYIAPEYAMNHQVTKKTDVYSFGVVLFELITGLRALEVTQSGEQRVLTDWVLRRQRQPLTIIDPRLKGEYFPEQAEKFIHLALACIERSPEERPAMSEILRTLESLSGSGPESLMGSSERLGGMQDGYSSTSSDSSAGMGGGTRPWRPNSGVSGSSPSGTRSNWSMQGHDSTNLNYTMQYNMSGIVEGR